MTALGFSLCILFLLSNKGAYRICHRIMVGSQRDKGQGCQHGEQVDIITIKAMVTPMMAILWAWILVLGSGDEGKEMNISRMLDRLHTWCLLFSLCLSSSLMASAGTSEFRNEQTSGRINKFVLVRVRSVHPHPLFPHKGRQVSITYSDIPQSWGL